MDLFGILTLFGYLIEEFLINGLLGFVFTIFRYIFILYAEIVAALG